MTQTPTHKMVFKKLGMSEYFDEVTGQLIPVTILEYQPMHVIKKGNFYSLAFVPNIGGKLSKPNQGQLVKYNLPTTITHGQFLQLKGQLLELDNDIIKLSNLTVGEKVDVQGISKGKGFTGVMKRYNFKGGRASHGASLSHRSMGSTGSQDIEHVFKGKKMPGRHGYETNTMHNLSIIHINLETNIIAVKGSVPGTKNRVVYVRSAIKKFKNQNPWKNNPLAKADLFKKENKNEK